MSKQIKRKWAKPKLTILLREHGPHEKVLNGCKFPYWEVAGYNYAYNCCVINGNAAHYSCMGSCEAVVDMS